MGLKNFFQNHQDRLREWLKPLGIQLDVLMRFVLPLGLSLVGAMFLAYSKKAAFVGGPEVPISPEIKDLILKRLDFFASEGQMYFAVVLGITGAGLTKAYSLIRKPHRSFLHWGALLVLGMGFFFAFTEWFFLQGTLQAVLKVQHFGESYFLKLMGNLQAAMVYSGIGTLILLGIPLQAEGEPLES